MKVNKQKKEIGEGIMGYAQKKIIKIIKAG